MSAVSDQIKQHLAQPDLNLSRNKAVNYLNDNHTFSHSTSSLEDAVLKIRHERDNLRASVRSSPHLPDIFLSAFRSSDGVFKLEYAEIEI
jgi:hypothetical protein